MSLTKLHTDIISDHPIECLLQPFRKKLLGRDDDGNAQQEDIAALLSVLVGSPAAFRLPTLDGGGDVAERLFPVQRLVRGGRVKPEQFSSLVAAVVDGRPESEVWEAVFHIIKALSPSTPPPPSLPPTFKGTPVKTSSSRLADSETRETVENELFYEIKNCTFRHVGGFFKKFFNPENWRDEQKVMLKQVALAYDGKRWADFPAVANEEAVWGWLCSLEESALADAPYKLHTTKNANQFKERKGQMDIFFRRQSVKEKFDYKDVLVVGEQKKSYDTGRFKADLLQLTRYVRSIFADQPTRRFVHAFTLCSFMMELWVFDRSGLYSSGPFNIHEEPDHFARALVGYATMDDNAMGLDIFIERKDEKRYVTLDKPSGGETRIQLKKAIIRQKAIVCRGTTCYETEGNNVAKLSWASDKRKLEVEQLRLAEEIGVKGVARVVAHRQITTIAALREGLQFPKAHQFRSGPLLDDSSRTPNSSSHKRKSSSNHTETSEYKRQRSNSLGSKLTTDLNKPSSDKKPSIYAPCEDLWENRIYSCLVISPAGRVISEFTTARELLRALRDGIKAHQSLYTVGNILHRDISSNNIIITDPEIADGFQGMLIDLDLAKLRDSEPSGARHQTGTMQFMAVEVLRTKDHTYRHDLESFFYVLLWMCARQSWSRDKKFAGQEKPPQDSLLRKWEIGTFGDIARTKTGDMTVDGLERIMDEFPESLDAVKPLCLKIRKILFPLDKDERMSFGTPAGDPDQLYRPIISAYNETIDELEDLE
ncbi:serine/threonine-protein kinase Sgk2 [Trichoderma compactum]